MENRNLQIRTRGSGCTSMLCACERGKRGLAAEDVLGIREAENLACKGVPARDQKGGGDAQF